MAINPELVTTIRTGELPTSPFSLTDKIAHEVGTDLKQSTIADLINFIAPLIGAMQYEIKTFHVTQSFIDANFVMTAGSTKGLGINLMDGFAICNGNNGTINKDGRVGVAYGETYNVIGQVGGSKDAVVVSHSHTQSLPFDGPGGSLDMPVLVNTAGSDEQWLTVTQRTGTEGVSGTGKNMQPYLVELQVMKL